MFMIFRIKPGHYIPHVVYYWHMDLLFTVNHYAYKNTHNNTHKCLREFYYRKFFRFRIIFWYGEFRTPRGAKSMNQSSQYELVWICIILKWIKMHKIHQIIPGISWAVLDSSYVFKIRPTLLVCKDAFVQIYRTVVFLFYMKIWLIMS